MIFDFHIPVQTAITLHQFFEATGILIGVQYYRYLRKKNGLESFYTGASFSILIGCLLGAGIGNKALYWLEHPHLWEKLHATPFLILTGQSIVGGLIGGWLGVEIAKYFSGVKQSTGDLFVGPILLGLAIGRVGCLLAGLNDETFGIETSLPWGIDFGDGIARHPTPIYEIIFVLLLWFWLEQIRPAISRESGFLFKTMFVSYLCWRLVIDNIKPVAYEFAWGLSGIQWACIIILIIYLPLTLRSYLKWQKG